MVGKGNIGKKQSRQTTKNNINVDSSPNIKRVLLNITRLNFPIKREYQNEYKSKMQLYVTKMFKQTQQNT